MRHKTIVEILEECNVNVSGMYNDMRNIYIVQTPEIAPSQIDRLREEFDFEFGYIQPVNENIIDVVIEVPEE